MSPCPECAHPAPPEALFCQSCGGALKPQAAIARSGPSRKAIFGLGAVLLLLVAALTFLILRQGDASPTYHATAIIGPAGGELVLSDVDAEALGGVASAIRLVVPKGALAENVEISMAFAQGKGDTSPVLELEPDGQRFSEDVVLTFDVDAAQGAKQGWRGTAQARVFRQVKVGDRSAWFPLPGTSERDGEVTATVRHFSTYAVHSPRTRPGASTASNGAVPAVLLVHGWQRDIKASHEPNDVWGELSPEAAGKSLLTQNNPDIFVEHFSYYTHDPIEVTACLLAEAVDGLAAGHPGGKVILVAHSMGGLVSRAYLQGMAQDREGRPCAFQHRGAVVGLATFGTPHGGATPADMIQLANKAAGIETTLLGRGVELAKLVLRPLRRSTAPMERGSDFLNRLNGCRGDNCSDDGHCSWGSGSKPVASLTTRFISFQGSKDLVVPVPRGSIRQNLDPDCAQGLNDDQKEGSTFSGFFHTKFLGKDKGLVFINDENHPAYRGLCDWLEACKSDTPEAAPADKYQRVCQMIAEASDGKKSTEKCRKGLLKLLLRDRASADALVACYLAAGVAEIRKWAPGRNRCKDLVKRAKKPANRAKPAKRANRAKGVWGGLAVTVGTYGPAGDLSPACRKEFGSGWRIAAWEDLAAGGIKRIIRKTRLGEFKNVAVTYRGKRKASGDRYYFATVHNHRKPSSYGSHAHLDNHLIDLGSWSGSRHVLCKQPRR